MFRVTREFSFCYGHRLLEYGGKCRHLHGHNGRAVITLAAAELDPLGMVLDFSRLALIAVLADQLVVEVFRARAHTADIQRQVRPLPLAQVLQSVTDCQRTAGHNLQPG